MKNKKDKAEFSVRDQLSSTLTDTSQLEPTKTSDSIIQSQNNNSKTKSAESEDIDLHEILLFAYFAVVFPII